jgi:DNA polymerase sigma
VSAGGFKFRRSAFRGQEPKVTLLVPPSLGIHAEAIPIDFSVNSTTPLYNSALLLQCGQIDLRARDLILLVKRWAKDRGVCHAAKGHLSPYAWNLLTVYFLQVGAAEGPFLPPVEGLKLSLPPPRQITVPGAASKSSVGGLFKEFVHFYNQVFDWHNEVVSVCVGRRACPAPSSLIPSQEDEGNVGPRIEDPFESGRNMGDCTTAASLLRMREELQRAEELLCARGASLAELLEPWVPPERCPAMLGRGGCGNDEDGSL